jgi:predicted AAA+ superfamily ATPase
VYIVGVLDNFQHQYCRPNASLTRRLNAGGLPAVLDSPHPREDLNAYVGVYLQEEIRAEALVRSVESFSRFLQVAALTNSQLLNYASVASDTGIPARTVREHYQMLEDTLIGFQLPPFQRTRKRKPVATAKFYLFDVGVANALLKRGEIAPSSELFGTALEHLVFLELRAYLDYRRMDHELTFWRTHSGFEVDFIVGDATAIEVKASRRVTPRDLRGLTALSEERRLKTWLHRTEPSHSIESRTTCHPRCRPTFTVPFPGLRSRRAWWRGRPTRCTAPRRRSSSSSTSCSSLPSPKARTPSTTPSPRRTPPRAWLVS